jgi:hypothetical protein
VEGWSGVGAREIALRGLRVTLGRPRQVNEGVGHHWFPSLARFPTGELLLSYILAADSNENLVNATGISVSRDGGVTWDRGYEVNGFTGGCAVRVGRPDGALAGPAYFLYPDPPGQWRHFSGHRERFEAGGARYVLEPWATRVEGLPRDVQPSPYEGRWGRQWMAQIYFWGDAVPDEDGVLTVAYARFRGDETYSALALRSVDGGRTWDDLATVAGAAEVPGAKEGPNESGLLRLADGDLMCVMRVGSRGDQPLARAYSCDGGRTWSSPDRLPAYSVAPCVRRLASGVLALSTGRPGISLWLSDDPRGAGWQAVDVLDHHNAALDRAHRIRPGRGGHHPEDPDQTTAYTVFVEVAPGRLLLVYDRVPFGWKPVPTDSGERNRIYALPIEVQRR